MPSRNSATKRTTLEPDNAQRRLKRLDAGGSDAGDDHHLAAGNLSLECERSGRGGLDALEDQLGLPVTDVQQFGLSGSAGSTPLRISIATEPPTFVFGKLYAHAR